jgi:hypothetical protein
MVTLQAFALELRFFQRCSPELEVVVFGGIPQERVAAFRYPLADDPHFYNFMYYIIPYPE